MADWTYVICDVFTERPLAGNQLAVFAAADPIPERLLQPLAREINFSETVFVYPPVAGGDARIRIFTPAMELPFAGHPVLGTAIVLGLTLRQQEVRLETGAGVVPIQMEYREGVPVFGWMTQPLPAIELIADPAGLLAALGLARSELPVERYDNGIGHLYVALPDEAAVAGLAPDLGALARACRELPGRVTGVNCVAGGERRWKSRMFAPVERIEDPATGSAAGPLACWLARHGRIGWGEEIEISQGAEIGRPSTLFARAEGDAAGIRRVAVGGGAVVVGRGSFDAAVLAPLARD
jgi:trans-2,3-dihydro-3-hydroxyanthranilate isomerase